MDSITNTTCMCPTDQEVKFWSGITIHDVLMFIEVLLMTFVAIRVRHVVTALERKYPPKNRPKRPCWGCCDCDDDVYFEPRPGTQRPQTVCRPMPTSI